MYPLTLCMVSTIIRSLQSNKKDITVCDQVMQSFVKSYIKYSMPPKQHHSKVSRFKQYSVHESSAVLTSVPRLDTTDLTPL